jgi:hypothetical protein
VSAQTVATIPGSLYTLSFALSNLVDPGGIFGTTSTIRALAHGSLLLTATNTLGAGKTAQVWKRFSFTTDSTSTTIAFMNADPSSDTLNGLDAVKLVAGWRQRRVRRAALSPFRVLADLTRERGTLVLRQPGAAATAHE